MRVVTIIDSASIKVIVVDFWGGSTGGLFSVPSGVTRDSGLSVGVGRRDAVTSAESRERRSQADGKGPRRLDAEEASWRPPRARAGCRDCDTDGKSNDRSPRSPRTSDADDRPRHHAGDSFRTIGPPTDSRARTQASSAPAPSSRERELCRSQRRARLLPRSPDSMARCSGRPFRSLSLPMGNGNGPLQSISCSVANQWACGRAGRLAPATPAPRPSARS